MAISSLGGIVIPIAVVRTGDAGAIKRMQQEFASLTASINAMNAAGSRMATNFATGKEYTSQVQKGTAASSSFTGALTTQQRAQQALTSVMHNYQALQKTGVVLTDHQQMVLGAVQNRYAELGGTLTSTTGKHRNFLSSFTQVRWAIVNMAMIAALTTGLIKLAYNATKTMFEFERLAGVTNSSLSEVKESFKEVRSVTNATNKEIISAFQELGKSGFDLAESTSILESASLGAMVGFSSLEESAAATSQALRQFNIDASEAERVMFVLSAAANEGRIDVDTVGQAMKFAGAISQEAGTGLDELSSVIAVLSNKGLEASQIGRGLRQVFVSLLSPSAQASTMLSAFNVDLYNSNGTMKSYTELIDELDKELSGLSDADKQNVLGKIFPTNALTVVLESLGEANTQMKEITTNMDNLVTEQEITALRLAADESVTLAKVWEGISYHFMTVANAAAEMVVSIQDSRKESEGLLDRVKTAASYTPAGAAYNATIGTVVVTKKDKQQAQEIEEMQAKIRAGYIAAQKAGDAATTDFLQDVLAKLEAKQQRLEGNYYGIKGLFLPKAKLDAALEMGEAALKNDAKLAEEAKTAIDETTDSIVKLNKENESTASIISAFGSLYDDAALRADSVLKQITKIRMEQGDSERTQSIINQLIEQEGAILSSNAEDGNVLKQIFLDIVAEAEKLNKIGLDFSIFDSLLGKRETKLDMLTPFINSLKTYISMSGDKADHFSMSLSSLVDELRDGETELSNLIKRQEELELAVDSAKDALEREKEELDDLNKSLSEVNNRISDIKSSRFTGETDVLSLLRQAETFRKSQELASLGVADAQSFITEALSLENDELGELFSTLSKVNSEFERNQSAFEAWQETIQTAILAEVEAGVDLGKDVTERVKTWQTALLGISATQGGGAQATQLDDFINKLQLAYDVHFGGMQNEVTTFLERQQDAELGVFDTSQTLIAALETEMATRAKLEVAIEHQTGVVENATSRVDDASSALAKILEDITEKEDSILNTISAIESLGKAVNDAVIAIQRKINDLSNSGKDSHNMSLLSGGSKYVPPPQISGQQSYLNNQSDFIPASFEKNNQSNFIPASFEKYDDFIFRTGQKPISISPQDTLIGTKNTAGIGANVNIGAINISGTSGNPQDIAEKIAMEIKRELGTL